MIYEKGEFMIKVLFVCLGNICRSPMAEYVFKNMVKKEKLEEKFAIDSAATSTEEIGNPMHRGTKQQLIKKKIPYDNHFARRIEKQDYEKFDYIIGMEEQNVIHMKTIVGEDRENKIYRLLDFSKKPRNIADPWYTGDFEKTYDDIVEGLEGLLRYLKEKKAI